MIQSATTEDVVGATTRPKPTSAAETLKIGKPEFCQGQKAGLNTFQFTPFNLLLFKLVIKTLCSEWTDNLLFLCC